MLGNGLSSSPSNTPPPHDRARFPGVTIYDNVLAQHRLVTERFGIPRLALVVGWSMGAQQTIQWAVSHPDMVERIAPFCGTARTTPHNLVFLEGVKSALTADAAWMGGGYDKQPDKGLRAFARVYAGGGFSQPFYKQEQTDLYFTPEDIEYEASHIPNAQFRVIPSVWGHQAGNGLNPVDSKFIDDSLRELLATSESRV
jgi:homoserine acetyltransferase